MKNAHGRAQRSCLHSGAGVGKGRTIAGLILENWRCGRKRHLWISIGSDLRVDARRDLNDANGEDIEIHALNKLQYGQLDSDKVAQLLDCGLRGSELAD